ncbi:elongation of very long chain fatty acids protein 7-like [Leptidea sinapis]|uniref:elongation of very long chain fatty acids protein 7-like n=1 Tax=Leptidea sinapis TaxID=189913 RepID=UPI0021414DEA|nr:elongation of very long chain fatty acids protein 7-like [Leptidea sinapis]
MAAIIGKLVTGYNFLFTELADTRTRDWILVSKPYQGLSLLVLYFMFVFKWGPKWIKKREPFNLNTVLICYNAFQVAACGYLFVNGLDIWIRKYKYICQPVDSSDSPDAIKMAKLVHLYFLLKCLDLLDTVFFVLRKKITHITFLHVYHHAGMVALVWAAITYYPGGHGTMVGLINSFVHIIMYSYYLLTVLIPSLKGSIWWKKYVTQLQILQFFHNVLHFGTIVFIPNCGYPNWIAGVFLPQNIFMLILFLDFYVKTYVRKPKQPSNRIENKQDLNEKPSPVTEFQELVSRKGGMERSALNHRT